MEAIFLHILKLVSSNHVDCFSVVKNNFFGVVPIFRILNVVLDIVVVICTLS